MFERVGRVRYVVSALAVLVACSGGGKGGAGGSSSGGSTSSGGGSGTGGGSGSSSGASSGGVDGGSSGAGDGGPAVTAKGTPIGKPATQTIDAAGGTVTSPDGRLDVTIPAGAFSSPTPVGIQVITDTAPNGLGLAYRLSPEGTTFSTPATLTFHLTDAQAQAIATTFVATQHADGVWYMQPNLQRGAAAKTVTLGASHFSDWAVAQTLLISPASARIRTGASQTFTPTILFYDPANPNQLVLDPSTNDELAIPQAQPLTDQIAYSGQWSVNGAPGGTSTFGQITNTKADGDYTAPTNVPNPADVAVSLAVLLSKGTVIATADVTIYAQETWKGDSTITLADGTQVSATFTFAEGTSPPNNGVYTLSVQSGTVTAKPVSPNASGCTVTISPSSSSIAPSEGTMKVTYDLGTGPDSPMVAGQGDTVWQATYTTQCPNGPGSIQAGVQAAWWPMNLGGPPTPVEAWDGQATIAVSSLMGTGTVHLTRQ